MEANFGHIDKKDALSWCVNDKSNRQCLNKREIFELPQYVIALLSRNL